MESHRTRVMTDWSEALAMKGDQSFIDACSQLLHRAYDDPQWYLYVLDDVVHTLDRGTPEWTPEQRLLSVMFSAGGKRREAAYREIRVARVALVPDTQRGDPTALLTRLLFLARAFANYRRTMHRWTVDPWIGEVVRRATEWADDVTREYGEMEIVGEFRD